MLLRQYVLDVPPKETFPDVVTVENAAVPVPLIVGLDKVALGNVALLIDVGPAMVGSVACASNS